jgi:hypothetical protein
MGLGVAGDGTRRFILRLRRASLTSSAERSIHRLYDAGRSVAMTQD